MNSQNPIVSFTNSAWQWLSQWWRRSDGIPVEEIPPRLIKVWDKGRGTYRMVNLNDKHDALWPAACELQRLQDAPESDRAAA